MPDLDITISAQSSIKRRKKIRKELAVLEREHRVVKLRTQGLTYESIAKELGYENASSARAAWLRATERAPIEDINEYRKIHLRRLETLVTMLWPKIEAGDLQAFPHLMSALKEEATLLGLYAPKESKVEVTTYDGDLLRERARQIIQIVREHSSTESRVGSDTSQT
jgi:transcriptional regulator